MAEKLGFLKVRQHPSHGYFGGLLIVNHLARPLEFHCTMPVKPSRAQVLLYGPTIEDFVCGEQIAVALLKKAKIRPALVLTDSQSSLAAQPICKTPMLQLLELGSNTSSGFEAMESTLHVDRVSLAGQSFHALHERLSTTKEAAEDLLTKLPSGFDFSEPLQRIEEALAEAHPVLKAA
ncbi:MAG: hypothetical protein AAGG44_01935 [Planctomycetota bacterium]